MSHRLTDVSVHRLTDVSVYRLTDVSVSSGDSDIGRTTTEAAGL